ncbi:MAG: hypothetical protein ABI051_14010 [Vicinamibacterales bacterium]
MTTREQSAHPLVTTAVVVGSVLGFVAARVDGWRGQSASRPAGLNQILEQTRQRVKQQPHEPQGDGIGALGEIARVRDLS